MKMGVKLLVATLVLGLSASAFAGTVDIQFVGVPLFQNFNYLVGGDARTSIAGIVEWQRVGGTEPGEPTGLFRTVCAELDQIAANGTYDVIPVADGPQPGAELGAGPMGAAKADLISKLWAAHWGDANGSADGAAAFQVGVWEIIYDGDLDLFAGDFQANYANLGASPLFVQLANTWLSGLGNLTELADLRILTNPRYQDQLVMVPLPSAVLAGGLLLVGVAAKSLRRRHD